MEVKNRFVVPPMGNNFANTDGTMSDQSVAYYGARAKGGFGLKMCIRDSRRTNNQYAYGKI